MTQIVHVVRLRVLPVAVNAAIDDLRRARRIRWPDAHGRAHERIMCRFYSQFVSRGDLCFDLGANRGNRTAVFRALGARVLAVEPQSECARLLRMAFCLDRRVKVAEVAVGQSQGEAEMLIASVDAVSSLSEDWIQAVTDSGRFGSIKWTERRRVRVATLDALISSYGLPRFIKIDVEGFEREVLAGLSSQVPFLSFEFTPEFSDRAFHCADRACELGMPLFNYSPSESMELAFPRWVSAARLKRELASLGRDPRVFGDVYAAASRTPLDSASVQRGAAGVVGSRRPFEDVLRHQAEPAQECDRADTACVSDD